MTYPDECCTMCIDCGEGWVANGLARVDMPPRTITHVTVRMKW